MSDKKKGLLLTGFLGIIAIFIVFNPILFKLNNVMLGDEYDGFKNYYTLMYHVKHDATYMHFEGMNYPYGEFIPFTDNQPFLANSLKFIHKNILPLDSYLVGIINSLPILSLLFTALMLFLIFHYYKVQYLYAAVLAIGVTFLAPNLVRMAGHYGLAYSFAIPLIWYLLLKFQDLKGIKISIGIALVIFFTSGLHMYQFAISLLFVLGFWFFYVLQEVREGKLRKWHFAHLTIQVIVPLLMTLAWSKFMDSVLDRPQPVLNLSQATATFKSVFLPVGLPLGTWINNNIFQIGKVPWGTINYVGIASGLFAVFLIIRTIVYLAKRQFTNIYILIAVNDRQHKNLFGSALLLLAFSAGIPFIFGLEGLLEHLGPINQFRAISRFAWPFYFAINISVFVFLYHAVQSRINTKWIRNAVLILPLICLFYDTYSYSVKKDVFHNWENPFYTAVGDIEQFNDELSKIDSDLFEAILPLPYFHIGSEIANTYNIVESSFSIPTTISYKTGIPMIGVCMSRTSFNQTISNLSLVKVPHSAIPFVNSFSNDKFILIIKSNYSLSEGELELLSHANLMTKKEDYELYSIQIKALKEYMNEPKKLAQYLLETQDSLYVVQDGRGQYISDIDDVIELNFDEMPNRKGMFDTGALILDKPGDNLILEVPFSSPKDSLILIEFWVKAKSYDLAKTRLLWQRITKDKKMYPPNFSLLEMVKSVADDWWLISLPVENVEELKSLKVWTVQSTNAPLHIDNVLIRSSKSTVIRKKGNILQKDNYFWSDSK